MAYNKIIYDNKTLIDLTADTVTASNLLKGITAHDKAGNAITGGVTFSTIHLGAPPSTGLVNGDIYIEV